MLGRYWGLKFSESDEQSQNILFRIRLNIEADFSPTKYAFKYDCLLTASRKRSLLWINLQGLPVAHSWLARLPFVILEVRAYLPYASKCMHSVRSR